MAVEYAVDTNILLRLSDRTAPQHELVTETLRRLAGREIYFRYAQQSLGEFWNVCTRPVEKNGFGLSIGAVRDLLGSIERRMRPLPESQQVYPVWRRLLFDHNVRGVQVHDAHLAAVLEVNGIRHLLTFNVRDFKRFSNIVAVDPNEVVE